MKRNNFTTIAKKIRLSAIIFWLITIFLPFFNGIKMSVSSGSGDVITTYKPAFVFMFGGNISSEHISYQTSSISAIALISYLMILIGLIIFISQYFIKSKKGLIKSNLIIVSTFVLLTASILLFSSHRSIATVLADAILGHHNDNVANTIYKNTTLGFGIWGTGLFGIITALVLFISLLLDGTIDKIRNFFSDRK